MQWGQIKTLFILCFLILDIFLVQQFLDKREQSKLGILPDTTIEEKLKAEDISLGDLPKDNNKETYISAKRYVFTEEDKETLTSSSKQKFDVYNNEILLSILEEPIPFDPKDSKEDTAKKVKEKILYGSKYEYWGYNQSSNKLLFFQSYNDKPIFFNESGIVIVYLNEDQEMVKYVQTMLTDIQKTRKETQELIKPKQAAITLYKKGQLYGGDNVSDMNLGYYTLVPLSNGLQVFAPTWKITVNEERKYFVNAMEGQLISMDESTFVQKTINNLLDEIPKTWSGE